jgi:quercetin dioxygenase-like cupin family protein
MDIHDLNRLDATELTEGYKRKVVYGASCSVARIEVKSGAQTQPHSHDSEEMVLLLSGSWRFYLEGREVTLGPNQLLTIPAGVEHSSEALEDSVALDVSSSRRSDWYYNEDRDLHTDADDYLWAV